MSDARVIGHVTRPDGVTCDVYEDVDGQQWITTYNGRLYGLWLPKEDKKAPPTAADERIPVPPETSIPSNSQVPVPPTPAEQPIAGVTPQRPWAWLAAVVAFGGAFGLVLILMAPKGTPPKEPEPRPAASAPVAPDRKETRDSSDNPDTLVDWLKALPAKGPLSPEALFAKASPSVVLVRTYDRDSRLTGFGSGFVVSSDGLVATNHHVIRGAHSARVVFGDNSSYPVESAVGDEDRDVAVIKIQSRGLTALPLAAGEVPRVGARVYAIGNPEGFRNTLSEGLVSGLRGSGDAPALIQTTAAISHGSSGGPLLSDSGEVVGITTLIWGEGQNLNMAVPVSRLVAILQRQNTLRPLSALTNSERAAEAQWTAKDKRNLARFFRALSREEIALAPMYAILQNRNKPNPADFVAVGNILEGALSEARAVRGDVLAKVHPDLPRAFKEQYIKHLELSISRLKSGRDFPVDGWALLKEWSDWRDSNKGAFRFPDEVPTRIGENVEGRWQGVRLPKFVPE
jgi:Trypsin-like peptidase domain